MAAEHSAGRETSDVSELRRAASLLCDNTGGIVWADNPASRRLGVAAGDTLVSRAAPGTEAKPSRLLEPGVQGPVRDGGHRLPVGRLVPAQDGTMVGQVHETIAELAETRRPSACLAAGLRPTALDRVAANDA